MNLFFSSRFFFWFCYWTIQLRCFICAILFLFFETFAFASKQNENEEKEKEPKKTIVLLFTPKYTLDGNWQKNENRKKETRGILVNKNINKKPYVNISSYLCGDIFNLFMWNIHILSWLCVMCELTEWLERIINFKWRRMSHWQAQRRDRNRE